MRAHNVLNMNIFIKLGIQLGPNYLLGTAQDADAPGLPGTETNITLFTNDKLSSTLSPNKI